jgi:DNA-binding response OmpR family regulator
VTRILVVEDEPAIALGLKNDLTLEGYAVEVTGDGERAVVRARDGRFDLILLDISLPKQDGFMVCREVRRAGVKTPIILLTARTQDADKVLGLELGADDYVTKPFSPRELVLRVKNLLKRRQGGEEKPDQFNVGDLFIDIPRHLVTVSRKRVDLTATEFKLLTTLASRRGRVQSREQLLRDVWEYDNLIDTRTVDTHMRRLREKLGAACRYLDTVRGVGYRFVEN